MNLEKMKVLHHLDVGPPMLEAASRVRLESALARVRSVCYFIIFWSISLGEFRTLSWRRVCLCGVSGNGVHKNKIQNLHHFKNVIASNQEAAA